MNCPKCHTPNPAEALQCARCGTRLKVLVGGGQSSSASDSDAQDTVLLPARKPADSDVDATSAGIEPIPIKSSVASSFGAASAIAPAAQPVDFGPRYRVETLLGEGGMGAVYKAYDLELERMVALKLIRPDLTREPAIYQRFKQELLLASKISHKNILRTHDLGEGAGVKFISMAFVEGQDLHHLLADQGKLPVPRAVHIARQLCSALEAAHAEGVVHRDLKPQNVLVDANDNIYVSDFGLAKSLESDLGMTHTGQLLGTPRYMSPEQAEAKPVDNRTDLYAFGLILCEVLTGEIPFDASTSALNLMFQRVQAPAKDPKKLDPNMPDYLARIISKCLERDPERRYQSASEILADLDAGRPPSRTLRLPQISGRQVKPLLWGLAAVVVLAIAVVAGMMLRGRFVKAPAAKAKAVTVLVADFTNHTGDPVFDGTLEPMFNVALEGASFINAYNRGTARKLAQKLPNPTDKLDEQPARLVALSQGISAVVTGEISRRGDNYNISAIVLDAVSGNVITKSEVAAANKDEVLGTIPRIAAPIRKALGDTTPEAAQLESTRGAFTAASLEVVHQYGVAMEQQFRGKSEDASKSFAKAAELDPSFARAYSGMASAALRLGQYGDAEKYIKLAMEHVDRMTDRERYRVRGLFYATVGNWQKCAEEYTELLSRYAIDNIAHNNLAYCLSELRNLPKAIEEARRDLENNPNATAHSNLALFLTYAGDFQSGEREAREALKRYPSSEAVYFGLVLAQEGQGQLSEAVETYHRLEKLSPIGTSASAMGLADLALYEGRFADATRMLEQGAASDLAAKNSDAAADKFTALAYTQLSMRRNGPTVTAARKALANSQTVKTRFLVARILAEAGQIAEAQKLAAGLGSELQAEAQAYAKLIEGDLALKRGDAPHAIKAMTEANKLLDTWIGRFDLGRAYLEAGAFAEADSEFDACLRRHGESLALFIDAVQTYGYFPPVYYYQGRVREGLKSPGFADSYRKYLSIRGQAGEDPLLAEIRQRLGQ